SLVYVASQLGHAKPTTTLAHYAHYVPRGDRSLADRLETWRTGPQIGPQGVRSAVVPRTCDVAPARLRLGAGLRGWFPAALGRAASCAPCCARAPSGSPGDRRCDCAAQSRRPGGRRRGCAAGLARPAVAACA